MTRPGARPNTAVRRLMVGLFAVAVTGLMAPVASATPESDADAAIVAAWNASGAEGGPLGARQGGVYAAGQGFGQDFASGKMFFTPQTGAHYVQGAILAKYEALGGAADSDLGFPTIDEGAGRAPDSRNSTFSAADRPVIFWTPATDARVVRGAINAAWDQLGGSAGTLGVPSSDEAYDGDVVSQKFTGGELSWNRKTKAFTTVPTELADQLSGLQIAEDPTSAIDAARRAAGGPLGPLGAKDGDQYPIGNAGGLGQNYAGGKIFYSPETGANVVTGQVLEKYESVGGPEGDLGFPTGSETEGGLGPNSRVSTFAAADKPVIFWTPDYGAVIVRGAMNAAWDKLGGSAGTLGAPMADQTEDGSVVTQRFSGGAISWDRSDNTFTTEPRDLATNLAGLEIPGLGQMPPPASPQASDTDGSKSFAWHWNWWWLLALIPVLVIAAVIVGAALLHRRRGGGDDFDYGPFDGPFDDDQGDDGPRGDRYPEPEYGQGRYGQALYDVPHTEEDGPHEYEPVGDHRDDLHGDHREDSGEDFDDDEATTSRFTEPYRDTARISGGEEQPEEVVELGEGSDHLGAPADEGGEVDQGDLDEDHELEEIGELDQQDQLDDADLEADLIDEPDLADGGDGRDSLASPGTVAGLAGGGTVAAAARAFVEQDEPDNVDTAPTRVVTEADLRGFEPPSGRHAAIELDEPGPSAASLHLPLEDPQRAPQGYPIKADTKSGRYWSPDSSQYDDAVAEVWFSSEEFARTNGFVRAD